MKRTLCLLAAALLGVALSHNAMAFQGPDKPGSKLITIQAGGGPGFGGLVTGNIAMANLGAAHLYGGLQFGGDLHRGSSANRMDLSLAPRVMLGFNLGSVFELHFGGLAGVGVQRFLGDTQSPSLGFCYGGFGGIRLNFTPSFGLVAEGYYAKQMSLPSVILPYGTAGIAFRF